MGLPDGEKFLRLDSAIGLSEHVANVRHGILVHPKVEPFDLMTRKRREIHRTTFLIGFDEMTVVRRLNHHTVAFDCEGDHIFHHIVQQFFAFEVVSRFVDGRSVNE